MVGAFVEYRSADGETFAEKELSFENGLFAPSFRMVDRRDGFEEGASWGEGGLRLFASRDGERKDKWIASPPPGAVIDAGFHRFMQAWLPELEAGRRGEFSFAVPAYGRFFRFRVSLVERLDDGLRLEMKPINALLRLLVDPIELVYDRQGRLLEFTGVTNIPDESGERHLARIVFTYPETIPDAPQVAAG